MTRRPWRSAAALLILAAPLVIALLLEGGSRIFYLLRWGRLYPIHEIHYSLRLGWELAPGPYRRYQINGQGFRRPEDVPLRRPAEVVRIFLVGGSTAFGSDGLYPGIPSWKLEYEDLVDSHLQTLLQSRHPGRRFEVINAAVPKYRLFQEITLFQEKLVNYGPDLVIVLDGHNDASSLTGGAAFAHDPAPYWSSAHTTLGQQVLNPSPLLGPLYYADVYLGRVSYFYHGLTVLFQRTVVATADDLARSKGAGNRPFRLEEEPELLARATPRVQDLETALPQYVAQVKDLKAVGAARGTPIIYALQPEVIVEDPAKLTKIDRDVQDLTFRVLEAFGGTLSWRYLMRRLPELLAPLDAASFRVVNLTAIADGTDQQLYTDYCHLTSRGNRRVAEQLYPLVAKLLDLPDRGLATRE